METRNDFWTTSFFADIFSKQERPTQQSPSTPVVINAYSQPHVLQQRMKEEKLSHGETVTANISPVRLESNYGEMVLYFCPMQKIDVTERVTPGDGGSIPSEAIVEGLQVPRDIQPGLYNLKNVKLFSNGTMQVIATEQTVFGAV